MSERILPDSPKWRFVEEKDGHWWGYYRDDAFQSCRICGYVRRADDQNKPCRGPVQISLRNELYVCSKCG